MYILMLNGTVFQTERKRTIFFNSIVAGPDYRICIFRIGQKGPIVYIVPF